MNGNRAFSASPSKRPTDAANARLYEAAMGQPLPQGHFDMPCDHTLDDGLTTCGAPIPLAPRWASASARNPGRAFYQVCHLATFDLLYGLHIGSSAPEMVFISTNGPILSAIWTSFVISWPSAILPTRPLDMQPGTLMPPHSLHHHLQSPRIAVVYLAFKVPRPHRHRITRPLTAQKASLAMADLDARDLFVNAAPTLCLFGF